MGGWRGDRIGKTQMLLKLSCSGMRDVSRKPTCLSCQELCLQMSWSPHWPVIGIAWDRQLCWPNCQGGGRWHMKIVLICSDEQTNIRTSWRSVETRQPPVPNNGDADP